MSERIDLVDFTYVFFGSFWRWGYNHWLV